MIRSSIRVALFLSVVSAWGCSSPETFDVTVTNRLPDSITVWITKDHGPFDPGWEPPETIAVGTTESEKLGGVAIQPGFTANTRLKGVIEKDNVALLRIYRCIDLNMMLTMHRGDPQRIDLPLEHGKTDIDIIMLNGQMTDVPHSQTPPPPH